MSLEQIKNDYAVSKGFNNWEDLVYQLGYNRPSRLLDCIDKVMILAQKECLKRASDKFKKDEYGFKEHYTRIITNENNIIK